MFMRYFFNVIFIYFFGTAVHGQDFSYHPIAVRGENINAFFSPGWIMLDSAVGDLNKDGINDIALILQHQDSVGLINRNGDTVLTQPRILLLLLRDSLDSYYHLKAKNNTFILSHDNAAMDDPYQGISINKGILRIEFHLFYNMGSWYTTDAAYKFRYERDNFILVGADISTSHRATLDYEDYSFNFLTNQRSYTKGNSQTGIKKTTTKRIKDSKFQTLKTLTEPFLWEIEPGVYL